MAPGATSEVTLATVETSSKHLTSVVQASVLYGPRDLRLQTRTLLPPLSGELQIAIKVTGICGSDVSYYKKFANGDLCACAPLSLGHESSGVVVEIGPDVPNFSIGDRVALEVGIPCGHCGICRRGRYNLCKKMRFRSSAKSVPHFQGTLQERINHPAIWCHKIPHSMTFTTAALLEPLSVALHATNRARSTPGSTALVLGAGTIGLLVATMAKQSGCAAITIVDVAAPRVNFALKNGFATHGFVCPAPEALRASASSSSIASGAEFGTSSPVGVMTPLSNGAGSVAQKLEAANALARTIVGVSAGSVIGVDDDEDEDTGFDTVFECTGAESCTQTAIYAAKAGGKVVLVGMGTPVQTWPVSAAHLREVDVLGVFRYVNTYRDAIRVAEGMTLAGAAGLDGLVTHRVKGLGSVREAAELAGEDSGREGEFVLKVVVDM